MNGMRVQLDCCRCRRGFELVSFSKKQFGALADVDMVEFYKVLDSGDRRQPAAGLRCDNGWARGHAS